MSSEESTCVVEWLHYVTHDFFTLNRVDVEACMRRIPYIEKCVLQSINAKHVKQMCSLPVIVTPPIVVWNNFNMDCRGTYTPGFDS